MARRLMASAFAAFLALLAVGSAPRPAAADDEATPLVEPGRRFAKVGEWNVSHGDRGPGCVAVYPYMQGLQVVVGGYKWEELSLTITVNRKAFVSAIETDTSLIELILGKEQLPGLHPIVYRGATSFTMPASEELLAKMALAPIVKLTEQGFVRVQFQVPAMGEAIGKLNQCLSQLM